ncbi:MAG TPA: lysylphosphatidylglycerol synthase transmembrane domain-containing protein [Blastocatellia bacterium]|nr:lysylphosphatidylglycerol synthase transmembrane domain-containing protein [Blastocatellia bacterium]
MSGTDTEALPVRRARQRIHPIIKGAAQIVVGLGALGYLLSKSNSRQLLNALHSTRLAYLPVALAATAGVYLLMAFRWKLILSARTSKLSVTELFNYYLIGQFFSNFVPGGSISVDVVRTVYADRKLKDKPFIVTTLLYDRLIGLVVLLVLGLAAAIASRTFLPDGALLHLTEAVLALLLVISAFLMSELISNKLAGTVTFLSRKMRVERLGRGVVNALESMSEIRGRKSIIFWTVVISVFSRVLWTLAFYMVALAMSLPVGLVLIFAFTSVVDLVRQLPIAPNGLGLREGLLVLFLGEAGIPKEQALMFSLLSFASVLLLALAGGVLYTLRSRLRDELKA